MKKMVWILVAAGATLVALTAQQADIGITIRKDGERPKVAVPDFRGDGPVQPFMASFNQTLWADLDSAGVLKLVPKGMYPAGTPQQLSDFKMPPAADAPPSRRGDPPLPTSGGGLWMSDWATPPTQANYLAMGYAAMQNNLFVARGWLVDVGQSTPAKGQVLAKTYIESLDEAGARKAAHEFAADILERFGSTSVFGTHIYFVRRTGTLKDPIQEVWVMDPDGSNQKQLTHFNAISDFPAVSPDGSKIAFNSWVNGNPAIFVFSVDPFRDLRFYNQRGAAVTGTPSFTPDGKQIIFASSAGGDRCCRIFLANLDGSGLHAVAASSVINMEPKVNPKTGNEIAFTSGRSGPQQIYRMNLDGTDVERLSAGTGEASNASWHPEGQFLAYAWTRGFMAGAFNIFVMDVAKRESLQLTHNEGKNENPSWAPDGKHIVFMSDRTGKPQIWSMLANGTQLQQLTTTGVNQHPVWGK